MVEIVLAFGCATAGFVAFVRDRRRMNHIEDKIREIRTILAADFPYRETERSDTEWQVVLQKTINASTAVHDAGLVPLGDLVMEVPGGKPISLMRAFVTPDHATVLYVSIYPANPGLVNILLESYATDAEYITHVGNPVRASPPFSHHQSLPATMPYRDVLERHRAFAKSADIRITNLDELMRELRRNHAMFTRWRESLSPDDLLEADLRTVLGEAYPLHGARWKRRLALRLPQARLRR